MRLKTFSRKALALGRVFEMKHSVWKSRAAATHSHNHTRQLTCPRRLSLCFQFKCQSSALIFTTPSHKKRFRGVAQMSVNSSSTTWRKGRLELHMSHKRRCWNGRDKAVIEKMRLTPSLGLSLSPPFLFLSRPSTCVITFLCVICKYNSPRELFSRIHPVL